MCYVEVVVAVVGAAVGAVQHEDNRRRQRHYMERQSIARRRQAMEQERLQRQELAMRHRQQVEAAAQEIESTRREATAAAAPAVVTAGEVGAFGSGLDALIGEFSLRRAEHESFINANVERSHSAFRLGTEGVELARRSAFASTELPRFPRPDYAGFAIQGIGSGLSAYNRTRATGRTSFFPGGG